jgi:radical SAM superfamily enzyme YgiQ (UPF0313 family)
MRIHFVFPKWQKLLEDHPGLREVVSGYDIGNFRMAGLGLSAAAGCVPDAHSVSLLDENIREVDFQVDADLVCLGFFTPQATNAFQLADQFRRAGKTVIAGGIHPTVMPEDAAPHFDAILRGPAEGAWDEILRDHASGSLKPFYQGDPCACFARPRRELFKDSGYLMAGVVQTARGCPVNCSFCIVPTHAGKSTALRPIPEVLDDIASLPFPCFFFADENLLFPDSDNRAYRMELFSLLAEAGNRRVSFIAAYPQFLRQLRSEEIKLMAQARLRQVYLVLGLNQPLARDTQDQVLMAKVRELKAAGIEVLASFNLGNDEDAEPVEEAIAGFCQETKTNLAEFIIHTPFPGTPMFAQMESEGRLLTRDWSKYNGANVVFEPRHESAEALLGRYLSLWRWFYSDINQEQVRTRYVKAFGGEILRQR